MQHKELDRGLITQFQQTEETSKMKASLLAITFGFFLVVGLPFAAIAGPTPGGLDSDGDGVENAFDNCILVANPSQTDSDHDGCGNACEQPCDFMPPGAPDGNVGLSEINFVSANFGTTVAPKGSTGDCAPTPPDGNIGLPDYNGVAATFGQSNGPAANTPACDPARCNCP